MFKACGLNSGVPRLRIHTLRGPWTARVVRSFATTLNVSRGQRPKSSDTGGPWNQKHKPNPLAIETNELQSDKWRAPIRSSTKPTVEDIRLGTEGEIVEDSSLPKTRGDANEASWGNADEAVNFRQGRAVWENEAADDDDGTLGDAPQRNGMGRFRREITVEQDFHSKLHATLLKNIMRREPLLRGMPVYDSTFDAVRSGRNLFLHTERPVRSLQYLLPVVQGIFDFGPWKRRREVKPDVQLPLRPLSVLVICPTLGYAQSVEMMGTRLVRDRHTIVEITTLSAPNQAKTKALMTKGFNILTATPEAILQWLAVPHNKIPLHEALQDVQTLVVDGKASSLRSEDFCVLLKDVMQDLPLREKTQRVIISDKYDPQLDGPLTRMVLNDDYEINQEPRLEEVQKMQLAREKRRRQDVQVARKSWPTRKKEKQGFGRAKERF